MSERTYFDNNTIINFGPWSICQNLEVQRYIEIAMLTVMFFLGAPVNVHVFQRLRQNNGGNSINYGLPKSFKLLQRHLNISDSMVLFIYVPSEICQRLTPYWRGGPFLCKFVKFADLLCFHISSNIIVSIALDRLLKQEHRSSKLVTNILLGISWMLAILCSAPQFYVWELDEEIRGQPQCRTRILIKQYQNSTFAQIFQDIYGHLHIYTVFWIPAAILVVCYAILLVRLLSSSSYNRLSKKTKDNREPFGLDRHFQNESCTTALKAPVSLVHEGKPILPLPEKSISEHRRSSGASSRLSAATGHIRALRLALVLVLAFVLCWAPYMIITLATMFSSNYFCGIIFAHQLIVFNSVLNPFLYGIRIHTKLACWKMRCRSA